ncbi:MAG: hypothetical protein ACOYLH_00005, partial [Flavobacteriales bacterium]
LIACKVLIYFSLKLIKERVLFGIKLNSCHKAKIQSKGSTSTFIDIEPSQNDINQVFLVYHNFG